MKVFTLVKDENSHPQLKSIWEQENNRLDMECDALDAIAWIDQFFYMTELVDEELLLVALDKWGKLLGIYPVSKGNCESCDFNLQEMATFLLLIGAKKFFTVHNHPSCYRAEPSEADISTGTHIKIVGELLTMEHLGDYVIAKDNVVWFQGKEKEEYSWEEIH